MCFEDWMEFIVTVTPWAVAVGLAVLFFGGVFVAAVCGVAACP